MNRFLLSAVFCHLILFTPSIYAIDDTDSDGTDNSQAELIESGKCNQTLDDIGAKDLCEPLSNLNRKESESSQNTQQDLSVPAAVSQESSSQVRQASGMFAVMDKMNEGSSNHNTQPLPIANQSPSPQAPQDPNNKGTKN